MRRVASARWASGLLIVLLVGCADSPMVLQGNLDTLQKEQSALARQGQELQNRASALDRDNQELEKLLAQERQRTRVEQDRAVILQNQLGSMTSELATLRAGEEKAKAMAVSMRGRGSVSISPNNSFLRTLPVIPGVEVRRDGDVIRVELRQAQLFDPNTGRLRSDAQQLISTVAAEIVRTYPRQIIGVEGYVGADPRRNYAQQDVNQLSVSQATAVYSLLVSQRRLRAEQLFIAGHGAKHPLVSNATMAGVQRNSRIELVIYPDRSG
jgi:flagellar motor protein MotB